MGQQWSELARKFLERENNEFFRGNHFFGSFVEYKNYCGLSNIVVIFDRSSKSWLLQQNSSHIKDNSVSHITNNEYLLQKI